MSTILAKEHALEAKSLSETYTLTMLELMEENPDIMEVEADIGRPLFGPEALERLRREYPRQFVDCGIQEANMIGVASGLSLAGKIPFTHTFAAFASRRAEDQAYISGSYARANVKMIGSDPGITAAFNGGTHMGFGDIGTFRAFPEMVVLDPSDGVMLQSLLRAMAKTYGMFYMRLFRKNAVKLYEDGTTFQIGKAKLLRQGADVTIIAAGIMVAEALEAARMLQSEGISARLLDMFTIKPLDQEAVLAAAEETGAIVTAENHSVINGLGSAVADALSARRGVPLEMVGVKDLFGEVGPVGYLKERFQLTAADIAAAAKAAIERKSSYWKEA